MIRSKIERHAMNKRQWRTKMTADIIIAATHWRVYRVYNMNRGHRIEYLGRGNHRLRG